jgi:threonine dehydrogenase-like Zn-dependent dehydrogenase
MQAVQFDAAIPRYGLGLALRRVAPGILWSGLSCTYSRQIEPPALPGSDWGRIKTRLGGICGTDLGTIGLHTSPYYSPFSSFPFTLGHENVGMIDQAGEAFGFDAGTRVVVEPLLWCRPRGIDPMCEFCARGEVNRCQYQDQGLLAPGLFIGGCRDTGGSWSEQFVAHASQIYPVPDALSDAAALMVEPFACALHAALLADLSEAKTTLIIGAGTIGLCTLAALRGIGYRGHICITARHSFQADAARSLGADCVIEGKESGSLSNIAGTVGGSVKKPILGRDVVVGGADLTFECVGSDQSLDAALRLTRSGGSLILVGVPGIARGIDWTALFAQELEVKASSIYHHAESFRGSKVKTFDLAIELLEHGTVDLGPLVTHRYSLADYKRAFKDIYFRRKPIIKAVFEFPHD